MGGVRAVRAGARSAALMLTVALACLGLACGENSQGQEAGRRDPELDRKVEEMLPRVAEFAHLPEGRVPAARRADAATLEAYLLERIAVEYPGDMLENLALAYQTFGLLPDSVDLRTLLVDLLLEQAVGFYDPARDVLFVRDEAPAAMVDALLAHELVHALQDGHTDLDSLVHSVTGNDARAAVQAAMEGHAMAAMLAFQYAAATGSTLSAEQLPDMGPDMAGALMDAAAYPQLAQAPAIVREPLLFAYLGGLRFVQRLWRAQPGNPPPFGEWLPESTEQLMHTERLLAERDRPVALSIGEAGEGWEVVYARDLGELEIRIYFEQHLQDRRLAAAAAAGWDGDAYALLGRGDELALVWYTAWDTEADADEFSDAYRRAFSARFGTGGEGELAGQSRQARLGRLQISGIPVVRVVETDVGVELARPPVASMTGPGG
jgi:hypothetical protein